MQIPDNLKYSKDHEWIEVSGSIAKIGITDFAQDALGDVVYVQLPNVGDQVTAGATCSEVESTKSVSDIYVPLTGSISAVNESLRDNPSLLNSDPYVEGWIFAIEIANSSDVDSLMSAREYRKLIEG